MKVAQQRVRSKEGRWMAKAARQLGLITRTQAAAAGMTPSAIRRLLDQDAWRILYPGVYAVVGHPRTWDQRMLAACLWCEGCASHRSAAAVFGLDGVTKDVIEVAAPKKRRSREGIVLHRLSGLESRDCSWLGPMPVVTPTRCLCDLGSVVDEETLELCLESALRRSLTSIGQLERRLSTMSGKGCRGVAPLRRLLELRGTAPAAESYLEVKAIRLLRRGRLPTPTRQHVVGTRRLDLAYPHVRLGIELLGGRDHSTSRARQYDAQRHNELSGLGWTILYFTYEDVVHRPDYVLATIRKELRVLSLELPCC